MNDFNRCNKVSGVYCLKHGISDLKIKIKLKSQDSIISLPKFEDYSQGSNALKLDTTTEEYVFKWQEKIFSRWEVQRYIDEHNCITDDELKYHENVKNIDYTPGKIFTYVHEDYYLPLPYDTDKKSKKGIFNLETYLEQLNLNDPIGRVFGGEMISTMHLFSSDENVMDPVEWMAMHVVFDNSDYNEESQLIYKQEVTLLSLYHNLTQNYLIMTPDVNNLELNPYSVETPSGVQWGYQYAIDVEFHNLEDGEELVMLLNKLHKRWDRKHKHLGNFHMPPPGKRQYYVALEILTAEGFDMDNLYIEFNIKVPEELQCEDTLHGRTHTSVANFIDSTEEWTFGHSLELIIEADSGTDPPPLKLFFEAISTDWWGRHRTEGYAYLPLPLVPGHCTKTMSCRRPEELDIVTARSRRFFLGGCHLIKDLNVLIDPHSKNANFTFTTTGTIAIRWNVISQSRMGNIGSTSAVSSSCGASTASALLRGAEAALYKYKQARARLAAATKQLVEPSGDGFVKY
ncbi:unnamed protein product [Arctia plantaginis]|uniref:Meckel syndrome type 1 protein n=1 Tax=Arctia plantaginis TaxID=874455 RepID=A0A8S1AJ49_ARCPL|nr:unnamed protein product [Arctia plantaginis]